MNPDWELLPAESLEGLPYWCGRCSKVGLPVTVAPQCSGQYNGVRHEWADMVPLNEAFRSQADPDLYMR